MSIHTCENDYSKNDRFCLDTFPTNESFSHDVLAIAWAQAWSQQVKYLGIMIVNVKITLSTIESEDEYRCQFFTSPVA